jgi:phosphoadenosine phosphosulfate reductase family protein
MIFYDFSGGMESAAMLVIEAPRILQTNACVRFADTGKQFPEMEHSIRQITAILGIHIVVIKSSKTFDQELFDPGKRSGLLMLRKGVPECSIRMKRRPLMKHARQFSQPWEINLGFNAAEIDRAEDFIARNERPFCHWRFPLQEANPPITREMTWKICEDAGFTILLDVYRKMGRFDCFWCPNQTDEQAGKVGRHYPHLAKEWIDAEQRKGHSFESLPASYYFEADARGVSPKAVRSEREYGQQQLFACACFGGSESVWESED